MSDDVQPASDIPDHPPSRAEVRQRRIQRAASRRRRFLIIPMIAIGLLMMAAGAYTLITGDGLGSDTAPTDVEGTSETRESTTSLTPVSLDTTIGTAPAADPSTTDESIDAEDLLDPANSTSSTPGGTVDIDSLETLGSDAATTTAAGRP